MALTKENSVGFSPAFQYPTYRYERSDGAYASNLDGSRIVPCPKGTEERIVHQDEAEHFTDYREWIIKEHRHLSDKELLKPPPFIGRKRNARWIDARRARGLA